MEWVDSLSMSLGLKVVGTDNYDVVISKGNNIPASGVTTVANAIAWVDSVKIKVYEGDYDDVEKNHFLGEFTLCGIVPKPKNKSLVDVTFEVDSQNIVTVKAKSQLNGVEITHQFKTTQKVYSDEDLAIMVHKEELALTESKRAEEMEENKRFDELLTDVDDYLGCKNNESDKCYDSIRKARAEVSQWSLRDRRENHMKMLGAFSKRESDVVAVREDENLD